jgi:hypothetical protein
MRVSTRRVSFLPDAHADARLSVLVKGSMVPPNGVFVNYDPLQSELAEEQGRSQWIDATLAWSLLAGVSKPKVFLGR